MKSTKTHYSMTSKVLPLFHHKVVMEEGHHKVVMEEGRGDGRGATPLVSVLLTTKRASVHSQKKRCSPGTLVDTSVVRGGNIMNNQNTVSTVCEPSDDITCLHSLFFISLIHQNYYFTTLRWVPEMV